MIIKLLRSGKCKILGWLEGLFNTDKVSSVLGKGYQGERHNNSLVGFKKDYDYGGRY